MSADEKRFKIKGSWSMLDSMIKSLQLKIVSILNEAELCIGDAYEEFKHEHKDEEDKYRGKRDEAFVLFMKNLRRLRRLVADFECEE